MKKIPVQVTEDNIKFMNDNNLSFSYFINLCIESLREKDSIYLDINDIKKSD
jgi:hypothetical protein